MTCQQPLNSAKFKISQHIANLNKKKKLNAAAAVASKSYKLNKYIVVTEFNYKK